MERSLQLQVSFHFGSSVVNSSTEAQLPSAPTIIQTSKPKMGVRVSKEVSVTILEACTAAEQAGEQQLDKAGTPTSHLLRAWHNKVFWSRTSRPRSAYSSTSLAEISEHPVWRSINIYPIGENHVILLVTLYYVLYLRLAWHPTSASLLPE
jgi:hypothetical protein